MLEQMNCVNSNGFYTVRCTHVKSLCAKTLFLLCRDGHYKAQKFKLFIDILDCIVFHQKSKHSWHVARRRKNIGNYNVWSADNIAGQQVEHKGKFWRLPKKHYFKKHFRTSSNIAGIFMILLNVGRITCTTIIIITI